MRVIKGLYDEQIEASMKMMQFIINGQKKFRLMRLKARAGTGKTHTARTTIHELALMGKRAAVCVFTGRGAEQIGRDGVDASTIHSLLYKPVVDKNGDLVAWEKTPVDEIRATVDYIVLDEGGMTNRKLFGDLKNLDLPMIVMGDYKQLDPINEDRNDNFNLMSDTHDEVYDFDVTLEVNRRTDPNMIGITRIMDTLADRNTIPRIGGAGLKFTRKSIVLGDVDYHRENQFSIMLCGTNKTRKKLNTLARSARGFREPRPEAGEIVMCLKNDISGSLKVNNGSLFEVTGRMDLNNTEAIYYIKNIDTGATGAVTVPDQCFTDEIAPKGRTPKRCFFTYGYATTVHKAQGSTFESVLYVDEDVSFFLNQQKFRYTGTSRASKRLTVAI